MFSKKSAVAAAALLAAISAQAQVNLYGNLDLSVGSFKEPGTKTATKVESGSLRGSFIGFKGQEDLGAGLKAFFKLESDIGADVGSASGATFWARTSAIGLQGDFGTVTLGNVRSLAYLTNSAFNPFGDSGVFSTSNLAASLGGTSVNTTNSNYDNSITYTSPNLAGFSAAVQAGLSEVAGTDADVGLQLSYTAGPLAAAVVYEDRAMTATTDTQRWELNASYDFGVAKAFAQYGQGKADGQTATEKFFQVGASAPVTAAGTVLASFGQLKNDGVSGQKTTEISLAYDHAISKRTGAYVGLNNTKEKGVKSANTFAVGVRHAF